MPFNGRAHEGKVGGRQSVVQPVVADREGEGHLGGIEKVRGVPVGHRGRGGHLGHGSARVVFVAAEACGHGEMEDAVERLPRTREQSPALFFVADGRLIQHAFARVRDGRPGAGEVFVRRNARAQRRVAAGRPEESGMRPRLRDARIDVVGSHGRRGGRAYEVDPLDHECNLAG